MMKSSTQTSPAPASAAPLHQQADALLKQSFRILPLKDKATPLCGKDQYGIDYPDATWDVASFGPGQGANLVGVLCGPCPALGDDWLLCPDFDGRWRDVPELAAFYEALGGTLASHNDCHVFVRVAPGPERELLRQWSDLFKTKDATGAAVDLKWNGGYAAESGDWATVDAARLAPQIQPIPATALQMILNSPRAQAAANRERGAAPAALASGDMPRGCDPKVVLESAIVWLRGPQTADERRHPQDKFAPISVEGQGGSNPCYYVANELLGAFGLDEEVALDLMLEYYNPRCQPEWDEAQLEHKLNTAAPSHAYPDRAYAAQAAHDWPAICARRFPKQPEPELPKISLDPSKLILSRGQAMYELAKNVTVYQRSSELVELRTDGHSVPAVSVLTNAVLDHRLMQVAQFGYWSKGKGDQDEPQWNQEQPGPAIVPYVRECGQYPDVRRLVGVATAPFMRPDGSIVQAPGYDATSGYFLALDSETAWPEVPVAPTKEQAMAALDWLGSELLSDFPFEDEGDDAVALAAILTTVGRTAIDGPVPAFAVTASAPGTGKGLLVDGVGLVATGSKPGSTAWQVGDEQTKTLMALARSAAPIVKLDNIPVGANFGGASLDLVLTETEVSFRVLGVSEMFRGKWFPTIFATGQALRVAGDTRRRTLICSLVSSCERPEDRTGFRHPDLLAWVRANRPALVIAALTVLRAYVVAGCPDAPTLGSYEAWARLVAGALRWLDVADPLERLAARQVDEVEEDPIRLAQGNLLEAIHNNRETNPDGVTAGWLLETSAALVWKDIWEVLCPPESLKGQPLTAQRISVVLRDLKNAIRSVPGEKQGTRRALKLTSVPRVNGKTPALWKVELVD